MLSGRCCPAPGRAGDAFQDGGHRGAFLPLTAPMSGYLLERALALESDRPWGLKPDCRF